MASARLRIGRPWMLQSIVECRKEESRDDERIGILRRLGRVQPYGIMSASARFEGTIVDTLHSLERDA